MCLVEQSTSLREPYFTGYTAIIRTYWRALCMWRNCLSVPNPPFSLLINNCFVMYKRNVVTIWMPGFAHHFRSVVKMTAHYSKSIWFASGVFLFVFHSVSKTTVHSPLAQSARCRGPAYACVWHSLSLSFRCRHQRHFLCLCVLFVRHLILCW